MGHCKDWVPYHVRLMPDVGDSWWTRMYYQKRGRVLEVACGPSWVKGEHVVRVSVYHPPDGYDPPTAEKGRNPAGP